MGSYAYLVIMFEQDGSAQYMNIFDIVVSPMKYSTIIINQLVQPFGKPPLRLFG